MIKKIGANMKDRRFTLGAGVAALAFALVTPAVAFAQDNTGVTLDETPLVAPPEVATPALDSSMYTQVDALTNLGFVPQSSITIATFDGNTNWDSTANDRFLASLDKVRVADFENDNAVTLREYLAMHDVSLDSVKAVQVVGSSVVILHS
jgi:hypothetical protein